MQMLWHTLETGNCPQLRSLNVSGITFKPQSAISMATTIRSNAFKYLEELHMDDCSLSTECVEHICRSISDCPLQLLRHLSLSKNRLNQRSLQVLCNILQKDTLPSLTYLDLSCNKISDEGIQELNNRYKDDVLTQVETLDLSDNCISNEGAFVIFDNIRHHQWRSLHDLNLQRNKFTAVTGVQLRSLLEMDNELDTIHLTDLTKRRANVPLYRREDRMGETHTRVNRPKSQEKEEGEKTGEKQTTYEQQTTEQMTSQNYTTEQTGDQTVEHTKTTTEGVTIPSLHEELKKEGELSPTVYPVSSQTHSHKTQILNILISNTRH